MLYSGARGKLIHSNLKSNLVSDSLLTFKYSYYFYRITLYYQSNLHYQTNFVSAKNSLCHLPSLSTLSLILSAIPRIRKPCKMGLNGPKLTCLHTVKKGYWFSRPQPGCHLPNPPWAGIIKLFPARESLVSDIPAGDGKIANLFLQCIIVFAGLVKINAFVVLSQR